MPQSRLQPKYNGCHPNSPLSIKENHCYNRCSHAHKNRFNFTYLIHFNLCFIPIVQIFQPRYQSKNRHRHRHSKIGNHLPIIGKAPGNDPIQNAEHYHQQLPEGIALCVEDQRSRTDKGCRQSQCIFPVKQQERNEDQRCGNTPECLFRRGKILQQLCYPFHKNLQKKKHPHTHLQRPNDV